MPGKAVTTASKTVTAIDILPISQAAKRAVAEAEEIVRVYSKRAA